MVDRALITGGAGFIGSHLVEAVLRRGLEVRVLVEPGDPAPNLDGLDVERVDGNLLDPLAVRKACVGVDRVFHLAALASDYGPWERFQRVNAEGTRTIVEAAASAGVRRLVLMSSLAVHDFRGWREADEDAPRGARLAYGVSKMAAEDAVWEAQAKGALETVVLRPGLFPFGPRDRTSFLHLARAMERGRYGYVDGGRSLLCVSYVENLAAGVALAGDHPACAGGTFVIEDGVRITWRALSEHFARALGVPPPRLSVPGWIASPLATLWEGLWRGLGRPQAPPLTRYRVRLVRRDFHFTGERFRRLTGWRPEVPLDEAIRRTVVWYHTLRAN